MHVREFISLRCEHSETLFRKRLMAFMIVEQIRKNSKEEWQRRLHEKWTDCRIWLQENGEYAAVAAFVCGLLIAYFFKFFIFLLALGVIIGSSIYLLAYSEEELGQQESDLKPDAVDSDVEASNGYSLDHKQNTDQETTATSGS